MKLTKKQQQFIKDAHNSNDVCIEWKNKIKDNFPKLFKETGLEVGKWYKTSSGNLFNYMGSSDRHLNPDLVYGFTNKGTEWIYKDDVCLNDCKPATKEEVEQALIAEAKKRGFKEGNHKCLQDKSVVTKHYGFKKGEYNYFKSTNTLQIGYSIIFDDGEWAEIIETITKEQAEKELGKKIVG